MAGSLGLSAALAQTGVEYNPKIAPASEEGLMALGRIQVPQGFQVGLFAAEPMLANPVAFCFDLHEWGRCYVAETFRLAAGVTDTRDHMYWLDDDLASRTVEDRVAMYRKHHPAELNSYTLEQDRVRLIEDLDGDGRADRATVFADGFHDAADGIGAGLLARKGEVWYACIPHLWLLRDKDGDGKADVRRSLHYGYGVHVGFIGHDLHGLAFGPDGKIYFSIGDRGLHVNTADKLLDLPDTGAVLRCNPDGSELEVFAYGLRNPQELAFDRHGNLFTGDNNSDAGDQARWVYVVEGGDSGWRIGYQFITSPVSRGPWNAEKLWHPHWEGQAAYIAPPIANLADGPSGLAYYPGIGFPERYQGHFFLCDFRGVAGLSGVRSFAVKPRGASFELVDEHRFAWMVLATDVDFGLDGALYLSDWVEGWEKPGKGRIYAIKDPDRARDPAVAEARKLLGEGMGGRPEEELLRLLAHPDGRIRLEAQFALAERGPRAIGALSRAARLGGGPAVVGREDPGVVGREDPRAVGRENLGGGTPDSLARLHALWALGQIGRKSPSALEPVADLLSDSDPEVRAQAAKLAGEGRFLPAFERLVALLKDESSRVRFFAAMSLGKLGKRAAVGPIFEMLRESADRDPYLRHAGVMGLVWIRDIEAVLARASDVSRSVRMAVLLVLRRLESPEAGRFLDDPDVLLVLEAARAINDVPLGAAMPRLAALVDRKGLSEPLLRRALNACFRLGKPEHAAAAAALAARSDVPEPIRIEALADLGDWAAPPGRDRVMGLWRPLQPRASSLSAEALRPVLPAILKDAPDTVREAAARLAGKLKIKEVGPLLFDIVADQRAGGSVQAGALKALEALESERLLEAVKLACESAQALLRMEGQRLLSRLEPDAAVPALKKVLADGSTLERQAALSILSGMKGEPAGGVLSEWMDQLLSGKVPAELQLDLIEAAASRADAGIGEKLAKYDAGRPQDDPMAKYRESLAGGDVQKGEKIFYNKAEVGCLRCHRIKGETKVEGGAVGPELTGLGSRSKREYILESMVDPNRQIAKGFETVVLVLESGQVTAGVLRAEDAEKITLALSDGQELSVLKSRILHRQTGQSAMPEDIIKFLTKRDLRDLVEFLASLK